MKFGEVWRSLGCRGAVLLRGHALRKVRSTCSITKGQIILVSNRSTIRALYELSKPYETVHTSIDFITCLVVWLITSLP